MSREKYKNDKYFEEYIEYEKSRVLKFTKVLESLKNSDVFKVKQCERYIATFEKNIFTALYSYGAKREELKEEFFKYLEAVENCGISDYSEMIDALSLSILVDVPADKLQGILENQLFEDSLSRGLKEYIQTGKMTISNDNLKFENHYKVFWRYLKTDGDISTDDFIDYVNRKWYSSCKEMSWYDSHTNKENVYAGYWCWLAAALLKVKNVDLNGYDMEYIPVELI